MRLALVLAPLVALTAFPSLGGGFPCPVGWETASESCDPAECIAPMGAAVVQVDRFALVDGVGVAQAFDSYEKIVSADGTPLHELLAETEVDLAGLAGVRRDYAGSAGGRDLRIALVLVRDGAQDVLMRAVWDKDLGALIEHMIDQSIAQWDPREG